jgi:hypothetical protein
MLPVSPHPFHHDIILSELATGLFVFPGQSWADNSQYGRMRIVLEVVIEPKDLQEDDSNMRDYLRALEAQRKINSSSFTFLIRFGID